MKQTITRSQFKEVDPKVMIKRFGDYGYHWDDITIGRMIEFLHTEDSELSLRSIYGGDVGSSSEGSIWWEVSGVLLEIQQADKLADALWAAVKEVLETS